MHAWFKNLIFSLIFADHEECDFLCSNKKCIDKDLICDKVDHCGDFSDEALYQGNNCFVAPSSKGV